MAVAFGQHPRPLAGAAADVWPLLATGALAAVVTGLVWMVMDRWAMRRAWTGAAQVEILAPPRVDPAGASVFWQHLLGLLRPRWSLWTPHVVFEYQFDAGGLRISVWVPGTVAAGQVAAAARSAWPGARTTITPEPRPTGAERAVQVAGARMRLARPAALPIATEHRTDPLRALIGAATPLTPSEKVRVQVVARPISGARLARLARPAATVDTGARLLSGVAAAAATLAQEIVATAVHGPAHTTTRHRTPPTAGPRPSGPGRLITSTQDRATATKAHGAGGGHLVAVRLVAEVAALGPGRDAAQVARARAIRRARAVASTFAEYSAHNYFRRRRMRRAAQVIEFRRLRRADPLSVAEVAALAHLPIDEHVPGLRRAGAAAIAPPPQVPTGGPGVRVLGDSDAVAARPIGLSVADARHHLWVLGATGSGKSTLLVHQVLADAGAGRAAIVIDPKGDMITDTLARLPAAARARTIVVDPSRPGPTPRLNPLDPLGLGSVPGVGDATVEHVVSVFSRVFASAWGHRSEDLLRVACLTLRDRPGVASLNQIPDLLGNQAVRARTLTGLAPSARLSQFWDEFDHLSDATRAQISAPLLNKLRSILLRPFAERLLCGPSTVDLSAVLDGGGLLLVRLPKAALGEDTVRLVGSLLVAQVWAAALARAGQPEHTRRDAAFYIDECHNFLNLPYRLEDMLAESRGFRLSLILAHQHLGQLTPPLRDALLANARNAALFGLSPADAAVLARRTLPELGAHDLARLDGFHAAATLLNAGAPMRAFTFTTRPLPAPPAIPAEPPIAPRPPHTRELPDTEPDRADPRHDARPHL
ncbi:type IV secretory system conjugative DNA transfer family protein [Pseudonocardia sp. ICBG601]|uniref:type IV secretory system conjugative DNA transfer family protein n=1 Tax=Pseudonocardia sp. ICBG601 TaxID=2846759 RepID=UPI001CF6C969|nr:type IV secretory system conjugative DNA transfer family protein [Pseudonocardia sp. ICBG601]